MLRHVEKLRAKPEHVRRRWALGLSAGTTGVIAAVWIATLVAGGLPGAFGTSTAAVAANTGSNDSPLAAMQASAASAFQSLVGSDPFNSPSASTTPPGISVVDPNDVTQ